MVAKALRKDDLDRLEIFVVLEIYRQKLQECFTKSPEVQKLKDIST